MTSAAATSSARPIAEIPIPPVLNPETLSVLGAALDAIDPEHTRFLVLKGGPETFCRGLDLRWIAHCDVPDARELIRFSEILEKLRSGPFITIAAVEGDVIGGGMGIALACDFVLASPGARFALTEGSLGLIPGIILPFLLEKMTPAQVKLMVFSSRKYSAENMVLWAVVHEVVDGPSLDQRVNEFARAMRSCKRHVIGPFKRMIGRVSSQTAAHAGTGIQNLIENLSRPEVRHRLISLAEFYDE
jgi:enoyl-CoA hydratase/carnithine racemase